MTVTVISTVGSDPSRDFSDPQLWADSRPADFIAVDQQHVCRIRRIFPKHPCLGHLLEDIANPLRH